MFGKKPIATRMFIYFVIFKGFLFFSLNPRNTQCKIDILSQTPKHTLFIDINRKNGKFFTYLNVYNSNQENFEEI